jgi:hypothetical protein
MARLYIILLPTLLSLGLLVTAAHSSALLSELQSRDAYTATTPASNEGEVSQWDEDAWYCSC